jgi:transposase, IS5 family
MRQPGLFDWQTRLEQLNEGGDPLVRLNAVVDWELFRPVLAPVRDKERLSNAGRKPYDLIVMFKVLLLQTLYNLSLDQTEYQIRDRLSFMRFLGLSLGDPVPDANTLWIFRETLTELGIIEALFAQFDDYLRTHGFSAKKGQIVDASIVSVPVQRNNREENRQIRDGQVPEDWNEPKRRQKDTDARWIKKNNRSYFGYKNHIEIDVKNKLIRDYEVTPASDHDSQVFEELLDEDNSRRDVYADAAYRSAKILSFLEAQGYRQHIQRKGYRNHPLPDSQVRGNRTRARIRARVEHVFGGQWSRMKILLIRTIGRVRAAAAIGLRNLAYNLMRYECLVRT